MTKNKNNVQDSPGTSDEGQLAASRSPYLPAPPAPVPYQPPPTPMSLTGPQLAASPEYIERKLAYRELAGGIMKDGDGSKRIADAAEAAAAKLGRR